MGFDLSRLVDVFLPGSIYRNAGKSNYTSPFRCSATVRFAGLFAAGALGLAFGQAKVATPLGAALQGRPPATRQIDGKDLRVSYAELPISFESSSGQEGTQFEAAGRGYQLTLSRQEAVVDLVSPSPQSSLEQTSIHLRMVGTNPKAQLSGLDPLPGRSFHFEGNDPNSWRNNANYARVQDSQVYPGVDLVYYGSQSRLEYDFVVAPGADINRIRLQILGAQRIQLDTDGNLVLGTANGEITLQKPFIYQEMGKERREVTGNFRLSGGQVGFRVDSYDTSLPLVIDPVLSYATYVGHSVNDKVSAVAVGPDGSAYVAGIASASSGTGQDEAFVAHIAADGKTLLYMTYLGGASSTDARGIALDASGNAYITGQTKAPDFPVFNGLQTSCGISGSGQCSADAFLAKLNADGSLNFATYLGGSAEDAGNAIAIDAAGDIYIAGSTASTNFPVFHMPQAANAGQGDAFVAKITGDGTRVVYATYLGGAGKDEALGIAVDATLSAYVTGQTQSIDFPTQSALQPQCRLNPSNQCAGEAFVVKLSPDGGSLVYSTYLGGSGGDIGNAVAVDASGYAYLAGTTLSPDFPMAVPFQPQPHGASEAFVAKLAQDGSSLVYSTFLGGSGDDVATSLAVDKRGRVFVSGHTNSADFPTQGPVQAECEKKPNDACSQDAFLLVLNTAGSGLWFSTYLGGTGLDEGRGLALDGRGSAYLGGATTSANFPMAKAMEISGGTPLLRPRPYRQTETASGISLPSSSTAPGGFIAVLNGLNDPQLACSGTESIKWVGGVDLNWSTAGNWSTGKVPVSTDTVCIDTGFATTTITIGALAAANQTIATLLSNANINLTSGPLTVTGGANFVNALAIAGGTLILNGTNGSSVGTTMSLSTGTLSGTDALTVNGLLTWVTGSMCTVSTCNSPGTGVTNANGGITIPAGSNGAQFLYGRTLNNAGTATLSNTFYSPSFGYYFYLGYGAVINNLATGTWNYTTDSPWLNTTTGGGTFNNAGTFEKTGGTATTTVNPTFNNSGSVLDSSSGPSILDLNAVGTSTGSWSVSSGDTLELGAGSAVTSTLSGTISGAGTALFTTGTLNLTGAYNVGGGTQSNGGTTNFNGTVQNVGTSISASAGTLNFSTPVTDNTLTSVTSTGGTVNLVSSVTNASLTSVAIGGSGQVNFSTGSAITTGTMTLNSGSLVGTDALTITGLLTWSTGSMCTVPACNAAGTGVTNANGGITIPAGSNGSQLLYGRTLNNAGTATLSNTFYSPSFGYYFYLGYGAVINNRATGIWNYTTDSPWLNTTTGGGTFNNAGTFEKTGGTATTTVNPVFNNSGSVLDSSASASVLDFNAVGTSAGSWSVSWGDTLELGAGPSVTSTLSGTISGAGTALFTTGTLNLTGAYNVGGGTQSNGGTTNFNGTVQNVGTSISASAGTLNFSTPVTDNTLTSVTSTGGTVNLVSSVTNASLTSVAIGGSGQVNFSTGSAITTGTMTLNSGSLVGTDALTITGLLTWSTGSMCTVPACNAAGTGVTNANGGITIPAGSNGSQFLYGRTLNNAGTATLSNTFYSPSFGYYFYLGYGATINNQATGIWNYTTDSPWLNTTTGGGTFNNAGTFEKTGGTATTTVNPVFNNSGSVLDSSASASVLDFNAVGTSAGSWSVSSGDTLELGAGSAVTSTLSGTISGAGTALFTTGTLNLTGAYNVGGGTQSNGGTTNFNGTVQNVGTSISASAGTLNFSTPVTDNTLTSVTSTGGTVNLVSSVTNASLTSVAIGGSGQVNFSTGSAITAGTMTLNSGSLVGTDALTITGLLTWSTGSMCTVPACNAAGTGVTNANGGITIPAGSNGSQLLYGRTLNNAGTATLSNTFYSPSFGYYFYLGYGAVINNRATGIWNYTTDSPWLNTTTGGGTFNNAGTFEKTGGTTTTTVNPVFNNSGSVLDSSASPSVLDFNAVGTSAGSWSVSSGDTLELGAGSSVTSTLSGTISGAGTALFTTGTLNLTGTYNITGGTQGNGGTANFTGITTNVGPIVTTGASLNFTTAIGQSPIPSVSISGGGLVNFSTGSAITAGPVTLSNGYLAGTDTLTINGLLTWTTGYMCTVPACNAAGAGVTNANGGITIPAGSNGAQYLYGRTLYNAGTATLSNTFYSPSFGYYFYLGYGSVINNQSTGIWNYTTDSPWLTTSTGGGAFNNFGTFEKTGGTAITTVNPVFNNSGSVLNSSASASVLDFNAVGTSAGSWTVSSGDTLELGAGSGVTSTLSGSISGAGTTLFTTGTLNLTGAYNITGGTQGNGGTANFTGTTTSVGPIATTGASLNFTTAIGQSPIPSVSISGSGLVNFSTGSALTAGPVTLSNGYLVGTDTLTINGLLTWSTGYMCTVPACNAAGTGVTNANGGITVPASSNGSQLLYGRTLNNAGTATLSNTFYSPSFGYYFYLGYGSVINNQATGIWNYTTDSPWLNTTTGGGAFNNFGTFEKTGGASTTSVNPTFNNSGSVQNSSSTASVLDLNAVGTSAGSWSVSSGDTLELGAGSGVTSTLSGSISGAGSTLFTTGTLNLTGTYNITGGTQGTGNREFHGNHDKRRANCNHRSFAKLHDGDRAEPDSFGEHQRQRACEFDRQRAYRGPRDAEQWLPGGTDTLTINGLLTWSTGYMCTVPTAMRPERV